MNTVGVEGRQEEQSAAAGVADKLNTMILSEMTPGSSLPSEAELASRYEVSRLTIREAVKMLAGRGLLDLGRGRRAIVRQPDGSAFSDFLTSLIKNDPKGLFDLIEVRLSLEVQSATLAAKRAPRAALAAMESAQQGMREALAGVLAGDESGELKFHTYDIAFHEALALASGNRVLNFMFEAMYGPLQESFFISRRGHALRGHTLENTVQAHQRILECVQAGNGRAAAEAMRLHLKDTERDIRAALSTLSVYPGSIR